MVCGGYVCTKNALCALNILYILVSLLLVGVAGWGKWFDLVSSIRVVAGVIGVGVFLFLVAFVGLCGALKHHQVLLFFYMMVLFIVFVGQFSVSCACLALNKEQQKLLLEVGWNKSEATQRDVEKTLGCCGFSFVPINGSCAASCFDIHPETCVRMLHHHTAVCRRGATLCGRYRTLLQLYRDPWSLARSQIQKCQRSSIKSWSLSITTHTVNKPTNEHCGIIVVPLTLKIKLTRTFVLSWTASFDHYIITVVCRENALFANSYTSL
ncbi:hypothetical protein OYC64_014520 [Pagothenia borchgrevinki]|uniref:Uncharacterized protein n=1 Tax=Pagothenia borchgrevinki TaxID=8213 RepID=A0ABD2H2D7_PAGBO